MRIICTQIMLLLLVLPVSVQALTLNAALRIAREHNQNLQMSRRKIEIGRENFKAAGRFLQDNPVLSADYTGKRNSSDSYTIGIGQTFELRGQRDNREAIADKGIKEARCNTRELWLNLKNKIRQIYIENWALQQKLDLYQEAATKEKAVADYARMRVAGGEDSPDVLAVTTMEFGRMQRIFYNLQAQRSVLKSRLSFLLGGSRIDAIDPSFKKDFTFPSLPISPGLLQDNPAIKALEAKIAKARSLYRLTKKNGYFPSIQAGLSAGSDTGERTVTASLSIPLPLFNTRRPEAAAAFDQIRQDIEQKMSLINRLKSRLDIISARMAALKKEELFFKKKVLPRLYGYLARSAKRYRQGEIDIFAYDNATRQYLETKKNYIGILQNILALKSDIPILIGENNE